MVDDGEKKTIYQRSSDEAKCVFSGLMKLRDAEMMQVNELMELKKALYELTPVLMALVDQLKVGIRVQR